LYTKMYWLCRTLVQAVHNSNAAQKGGNKQGFEEEYEEPFIFFY